VRVAVATVLLGVVVSACGGGAKQGVTRTAPSPVSEQIREALSESLNGPALPDMATAQRPRLPFVAVTRCAGPSGGGAGRYECATKPRGSRGIRSVAVDVRRDGSWSTQQLTVQTGLRAHRSAAVTSVWGVGIRISS
jgi:hypothetical protein